jgi:V/A-type H+-transporting ATPase subunit I
MIVDIEKYLIFGNRAELDQFFSLAQRAGFLEFIGTSRRKALELPQSAKTFLSAIRIAKHYPIHPLEAPSTDLSIDKIAEKIVAMKAEEESFYEEERVLVAEIARISAFGDFSREELDRLEIETKRSFQFYCMKSDLVAEVSLPSELIHVGTEYDLDYFVAINEERKQYPKMIEILIDQPVGKLRERLQVLREDIAKIESDIRTFSNYLPDLQSGLIEDLNAHHLQLAKHNATLSLNNGLFAIEAWVPSTRVKSLFGLLSDLNVDAERISVEKRDQIPTYLENTGTAKIGEDILHIFDTPSHKDTDPSMWVLVFFSLFFSMIIADAGYGFIFLMISLLLRSKFPNLQGVKRRMVRLSIILSTCSILWGVITASYFGIALSPNNPIQKVSLLSFLVKQKADYHLDVKDDVYEEVLNDYPAIAYAKNGEEVLLEATKVVDGDRTYPVFEEFSDNVLLEFSFLIGILHISLSFFRYLGRNWSGLGWVFSIVGGYLYFPSIINATVLVNFMGWIPKPEAYFWGVRLIVGGVFLAFILALIQKKWGAFQELLHSIQIFADILSYLRLYALALGSMVMAHTFNDALGINPGIVVTILLIIFGHATNIAICLMGSVVHGLRLNFLEWFHYSFEGGGRLFNPLRLNKSK